MLTRILERSGRRFPVLEQCMRSISRRETAALLRLLFALVVSYLYLVYQDATHPTVAYADHVYNHLDGQGTCQQRRPWNPNAYGLTQVYFEFTNGDHKIKEIKLLRGGGNTYVNFQDGNCDDPYRYSFTYEPVPGPLIFEQTEGTCLGTCRVNLTPPANHTFLLQGFYFEFIYGDRNISRIAVYPSNESRILEVSFEDRQVDADDQYRYIIQYAWIPNNGRYGWQNQTFLATGRGACVVKYSPNPRRPSYLGGFQMSWFSVGTDHYLQELAIVFTEPIYLCAAFQDSDGAERARYRIWWLEDLT
jgi:hypothetical protein